MSTPTGVGGGGRGTGLSLAAILLVLGCFGTIVVLHVVRPDLDPVRGLERVRNGHFGWRPVTIDEVFDIIDYMRSAETFTAIHDKVSGHPLDVYVDEFADAWDDEFHIRISDFGLDPEVPALPAD